MGLTWIDIALAVFFYFFTLAGTSVGFHRYFTHRSFKAGRPLRIGLAIVGSMAFQGPIITWVADHRRHHAFTDKEGDPHSPSLFGTTCGGRPRLLALAFRVVAASRTNEPGALRDRSTNFWPLAIVTMGESWHNLHPADPTCARHGVARGQIDMSAAVIAVFERFGWTYDVRWPTPRRLARLAAARARLGGLPA
jgi:fatty-acid desaturase